MSSSNQIEIMKKAKVGLIALSTRTLILNVLQVVSRIVLARNLMAADFGVYGILQGWIGALMFFTDIGLGDVLTRRVSTVERSGFQTYFFVRSMLSIFITVLFIILFPFIKEHYQLQFPLSSFAWVISFFILIDVFAACPMLLMGQNMEFVKIAKIELVGLLGTYLVQIIVSFFVKSPWALFAGLMVGKVLSLMLAIKLSTEIPLPKLDKTFLKQNYKQGLFFQSATILPALQAILFPFIMSFYLSVEQMGLIFWIEGLVSIPLSLIYNYNRVAFISLSKFSEDKLRLKDIIASFMLPTTLGICFIFGLGAVLSKNIIALIFGTKWALASNYIHLSCIAFCLYCLRFLGLSVLSAIDRPKVRALNEVFLLIISGAFIFMAIQVKELDGYFGGLALANLFSLLVMLYCLRHELQRSIYVRGCASFMGMMVSIVIIFQAGAQNWPLPLTALFYCLLFFTVALVLDSTIKSEIRKLGLKVRTFSI